MQNLANFQFQSLPCPDPTSERQAPNVQLNPDNFYHIIYTSDDLRTGTPDSILIARPSRILLPSAAATVYINHMSRQHASLSIRLSFEI
jgi:hypothetical protein